MRRGLFVLFLVGCTSNNLICLHPDAETQTFVFQTPVPSGETFHVVLTINRFAVGEATDLTHSVND